MKNFINLTSTPAPELENLDTKLENTASRSVYLQEARKKYHFNDESIPTFRLNEWEDDNGTNIEEAELWRPLDMNLHDYNKLVEDNIAKAESSRPKRLYMDSSVHCAQKEHNHEYLRNEPLSSKVNQSQHDNEEQARSPIIGRRLFTNLSQSESKQKTPLCVKVTQAEIISSPEIQFLGEKNFKQTCNNMCKESESLYNTNLTLGTSSYSCCKENMPPKRVVNPSKYVSSPYEIFFRGALTQEDLKRYETLITICNYPEFKDTVAINIDNCRVFLNQLGNSFKPGGWVEAYVINAFCRKLFRDNHPRNSNKHYFFHTVGEYFLEKWKTEPARIRWRDNAIRGFKGAGSVKKLHLSDRLYFPSHHDSHWFVFIVDLRAHSFFFVDSLYGETSSYHTNIKDVMIENFKKTWIESDQKLKDFDDYTVSYPKVPKQTTGDDCGIFAMKLMELWCPRNALSCLFTSKDIPRFRIKLAIDNLFNDYNTEHDAKILIASFKLKEYKAYAMTTTGGEQGGDAYSGY